MIRVGENRNIYVVLVGKLGRNRRLEDPGLDGGLIPILFSQKQDMRSWTVLSRLRTGARGGFCEHLN